MDPRPGQIALAEKAGFAADLLLATAPPSVPWRDDEKGKTPCRFGRWGWTRYGNWQAGMDPETRRETDKHGCNVGLLLGVEAKGQQYLMLDVDTDPEADEEMAKAIQREVTRLLAGSMLGVGWLRFTRPTRLGMLLRLPADAKPGSVTTTKLARVMDGVSAGQIQLLAKGQQTVIGGMHPCGAPIRWKRIEYPSQSSIDYPDPVTIPMLENREKADGLVEYIVEKLIEKFDLFRTTRRRTIVPGMEDDTPLPLDRQSPWDAVSFIRLFDRMPHDSRVTRDDYVRTMLAAAGAISATEYLGSTDEVERQAMASAAIRWAARWEDPKGAGTDEIREREAWDNDFAKRNVQHLGWEQLMQRAITLGDNELRGEWARRQFANEVYGDEPPSISQAADIPVAMPRKGEGLPADRRSRRLRFDVTTSQIQVADAVEREIGEICRWLPAEKQWITWGGSAKGWTDPFADRFVRRWIEDSLVSYCDVHGDRLGDSETSRAKLTSEACVSAIEKLLRHRLSMLAEDTNLGRHVVQTPDGMWSMDTGQKIASGQWENQRDMFERRMATVAPKDGPTPLFDDLLNHVACQDPAIVEWLWAWIGYALLGDPKVPCVLIMYGPGGNGKSKFAGILRRLFGNYAATIDRRVVVKSGSNDHPTALNETRNKRLWLIPELQPNESWNEANIRVMTGGDNITARGMRENMTEFKIEGIPLIYTNFVPALHRVDGAVVRRFRFVNARVEVPADKRDLDFEDKTIEQEGPQILRRAIAEAHGILTGKWGKPYELPPVPPGMSREAKRYFAVQDMFYAWFSDECITCMDGKIAPIGLDDLYKRYQMYSKRVMAELDGGEGGSGEDGEISVDLMGMSTFMAALRRAGALVEGSEKGERKVARGMRLKVAVVAA